MKFFFFHYLYSFTIKKSGVQQYEVVVALDEIQIENTVQFREYLYKKKKLGDTIKVNIYRNVEKLKKRKPNGPNKCHLKTQPPLGGFFILLILYVLFVCVVDLS